MDEGGGSRKTQGPVGFCRVADCGGLAHWIGKKSVEEEFILSTGARELKKGGGGGKKTLRKCLSFSRFKRKRGHPRQHDSNI